MDILRRHALRKKDFREMKEKLREVIGDDVDTLFVKGAELIVTEAGNLYAENKVILAFEIDERILPSLRALNNEQVHLPSVTVDMGAIPYVTNGADIMAPGITNITPELQVNDFVVIIDETYGKSLAIGQLLLSSEEISQIKKGKVIKNVHYVNDTIWSFTL
ncbi:MAG: DUF1947 domain-containing protein [Candidatus Heimdallarchaeota archaeon]